MSEDDYVQVSRDPFARGSLMREAIRKEDVQGTCAWCGGLRPSGGLFHYGWSDDQRPEIAWDDKLFDSVDCRRTYYGMEA